MEGARTAHGFRFGATFGITVSTGWTDASGVVTIRNPMVSATLRWEPEPAKWAFDGSVGGSFVFNRVPFAGDAASWLGELFDGGSVEFDRIPLTRLGSLGDAFFRVALKQPLRVPLWDIFNFEIRGIGIRKAAGLSFDGDVGFSFGEVRFLGSIPELAAAGSVMDTRPTRRQSGASIVIRCAPDAWADLDWWALRGSG